jgi:hypothetical protein
MEDDKKPNVHAKLMKTMDPSKTEVILYMLFDTDKWSAAQAQTLAVTLLSEKIGWTSPEEFYRILDAAQAKPTHSPPSQLQ